MGVMERRTETPNAGRPRHACRTCGRPPGKGFTLFELAVAFGMFITIVAGTWTLLANAHRHEETLWDELLAEEWAVSVLEQSLAAEPCPATPADGLPVPLARLGPRETAALPDARAVLRAVAAAGSPGVVELHVVVSWNHNGAIRSLERTVKRRATP